MEVSPLSPSFSSVQGDVDNFLHTWKLSQHHQLHHLLTGKRIPLFPSTQSHTTQSVDDSWEWGARHQRRLSAQLVQTLDESQCDVGGFESDDSMKLQTVTTSKKSKSISTRQRGLARAQRDLLKSQAPTSFGLGKIEKPGQKALEAAQTATGLKGTVALHAHNNAVHMCADKNFQVGKHGFLTLTLDTA
jgi:hypothetical protein